MDLSELEKERYSRHLILEGFGEEAQIKLKQARVLVIGAGGLGCPALIYLASAGIGTIGIADNDKVSLSNLQRQVLYSTEEIGQYKVEAAKRRLESLNPLCRIEAIYNRIDADNALRIFQNYDIIIDGSDNFSTRYLVNDACVILSKPFVYGAVFKFGGQLSVFNYNGSATYRCLFPEPPKNEDMPSCNETGVLGVLPGIIGTWQACEAIKMIAGIGEVLSGKLMTIDLLNNKIEHFDLFLNSNNLNIKELKSEEYFCRSFSDEIDISVFQEWQKQKKIQLIDVRTVEEFNSDNIGGVNIPLANLINQLHKIDSKSTLVVRCRSGIRARKALNILKEEFKNTPVFVLMTNH